MNRATLIGRIGKDPETRTTQNGAKVISFSLATSERWKDKNTGEKKEKTEWHNVVCWNESLGKIIESYCKKGAQIAIEGQIQTRKWEDKDGATKYTTEIVIPQFGGALELLGESRGDQTSTKESSKTVGMNVHLDDDIPFAPEFR